MAFSLDSSDSLFEPPTKSNITDLVTPLLDFVADAPTERGNNQQSTSPTKSPSKNCQKNKNPTAKKNIKIKKNKQNKKQTSSKKQNLTLENFV